MLEFSDAKYRFFPAKPSPLVIRLGQVANRHLFLPGRNHRIAELKIEGETETLREARARGDRLIFVINHPSHSDPQVVSEVHRRLGIPCSFMAAYDVFLRSRFDAWCMQRFGHFSIDREAADRKAMTAALAIAGTGAYCLNIFPEGNVYLTNDRVTPFLDGTAFIALKAQQSLPETRLLVVPMSLKFTHLGTPRETVTRRLVELGRDSGYDYAPGSSRDPLNAVMGLGRHLLGIHLSKHGFLERPGGDDGDLYARLGDFAAGLVSGLEDELALAPAKEGGLVERIRKIRSAIHQARTDSAAESRPELEQLAGRAILALRVHGYLVPYLTEHPTIDRYDETVERIAEDRYSRAMPRTGPRRAIVRFQPPLDVAAALAAGGGLRGAVASLTRAMEHSVQSGIDAINAANDCPGAQLVPAPDFAA